MSNPVGRPSKEKKSETGFSTKPESVPKPREKQPPETDAQKHTRLTRQNEA